MLGEEIAFQKERIKEIWSRSEEKFPDFLRPIPEKEKAENEKSCMKLQKKLKRKRLKQEKRGNKYEKEIIKFLKKENIIGIHRVLKDETMQEMTVELKKFITMAERFEPDMGLEDFGQAARNYLVYAMFNEMSGVRQEVNKAVFGYSMLYPVTDNYIDSKEITKEKKESYNQFILEVLRGNISTAPEEKQWQKTYELLKGMEENYERGDTLYLLLEEMLYAQRDSMRQQITGESDLEKCVDISIYKGGISVLIDRYFVKKKMTKEDVYFYLGFGYFLQLADDLQDIQEDMEQGSNTVLTHSVANKMTEQTVNRIFWYLKRLMENYRCEKESFKQFVWKASNYLIAASVFLSPQFFSEEYCIKMDKSLPVGSGFFMQMKEAAKDAENREKSREMTVRELVKYL